MQTKGVHHEEADLGVGERGKIDSSIHPFIDRFTRERVLSLCQEFCWRMTVKTIIGGRVSVCVLFCFTGEKERTGSRDKAKMWAVEVN